MSQHSPLNQQTLNQQIASLQQQLPRQRQQLAQQTAAVGTALCYRLGSPSALALAALTGVVGGLWFYRRDTDTEAVPADDTAISTPTERLWRVMLLLWSWRSLFG